MKQCVSIDDLEKIYSSQNEETTQVTEIFDGSFISINFCEFAITPKL